MDTDRIARRTSRRPAAITIERTTGRKYRLVKRYEETGKYMESATLRRYSLLKEYV